jgi:hypothetical protein
MPPAKLSGALPDDTKNGMFAPANVRDFLGAPTSAVYVIAVLTNWKTETNNDTGEVTPVMKIRHIEVVDKERAPSAAHILHQLHEARTGELALPFEWGHDVPRPDRDFEEGAG